MKLRFARHIRVTLAAVIAVAAAPAWSDQYFGNRQDGSPSAGLTGDYKRGSKFTLFEPAVLSTLRAPLDGFGGPQTGYQNVTMVIYADANGTPGAKLAETFPLRINAQAPQQEFTFYMRSIPLPVGAYWLVLHSDGTAGGSTPGIVRDLGTSGVNNWYGNADSYADGASSPFGAGSTGTGTLAVSGSYLPPGDARFAGRATVAATPSSGLTSHFKRGARFTMGEAGRLFALTAYLDGNGGGSGTQKLRYALYRDVGGVPATLVRQSDEVTVTAGQAAGWVTASLEPTDLAAGDYWVVIHTGDTSGVARDYGDGAANWYGNADPYADGASTNFGSGSAGTGTISAAAMYLPGSGWVSQTRGRTTVGAAPSAGLTANYSRGSRVGATLPYLARATAIWAYLDGNGGGVGTQQVRAVLYDFSGIPSLPYDRIYETEPVTIAAGMSPRWVRFPLTAPVQIDSTPSFLMMLHSGDNAGVVRDYGGDGDANWLGLPDAFADGAIRSFYAYGPDRDPTLTEGTGTLSMYIEYSSQVSSP